MHDGSEMEDYVGDKGELVLTRSIIIRGYIIRMIESKLGTNGYQLVRPVSNAD